MAANFFVNLSQDDFEARVRGQTVLTIGQVARLCGGTAPRTVSKWFDKGLLRGYRLPGDSKDRRVPKAELIRFMKDNGLPVPRCLQSGLRVTVATDDAVLFDLLRIELPQSWSAMRKFDLLDAAISVATSKPDVVILDFRLGRTDCLRAAVELAPRMPDVKFFALCPEGDPGAPPDCFVASWVAPHDAGAVAAKLRECLRWSN